MCEARVILFQSNQHSFHLPSFQQHTVPVTSGTSAPMNRKHLDHRLPRPRARYPWIITRGLCYNASSRVSGSPRYDLPEGRINVRRPRYRCKTSLRHVCLGFREVEKRVWLFLESWQRKQRSSVEMYVGEQAEREDSEVQCQTNPLRCTESPRSPMVTWTCNRAYGSRGSFDANVSNIYLFVGLTDLTRKFMDVMFRVAQIT